MFNFLVLLVTLFMYSCSNIRPLEKKVIDPYENIKIKQVFVKPGEVSYLSFKLPTNRNGELYCDKTIPFIFYKNTVKAFISESYFSNNKMKRDCKFIINDKKIKIAQIHFKTKKFPSERLKVNKKVVNLNAKDLKRALKEKSLTTKIYKFSSKKPFFNSSFALPINSKVTSIYGSRRIFNNNKQTQHLGTDYRAKIGTIIKSTNRGKVVLAKNLFFSGNTIIIDHGLDIFSIYGHLSEFLVKESQVVNKGDIIAKAGKTGRVTGPHLHWSLRVQGNKIEGDSIIKASKEYFRK